MISECTSTTYEATALRNGHDTLNEVEMLTDHVAELKIASARVRRHCDQRTGSWTTAMRTARSPRCVATACGCSPTRWWRRAGRRPARSWWARAPGRDRLRC